MESIKLKQLLYLCGTSCACGLIIGIATHEDPRGITKVAVGSVVSTVAASWVVRREDLQQKFESGIVEATERVKTNIVKVKNKIQGSANSSSSAQSNIITGRSPRKELPPQQTPPQPEVTYQNPTPQTVEPEYTPTQNQQQYQTPPAPPPTAPAPAPAVPTPPPTAPAPAPAVPQENEIFDRLRILQDQNTGLQEELKQLHDRNKNLQDLLKVSDERREEFDRALESLDEQSELFKGQAAAEQVGLEKLLDDVPAARQQSNQQRPDSVLVEQSQFEDAISQFSQSVRTPKNSSQTPPPTPEPEQPEFDYPEELRLGKEKDNEDLSDDWANELENIVDEDSQIQKSAGKSELDLNDFPSELADELEDIVVEKPENNSQLKADEIDLLSEFSESLERSEDKQGKSDIRGGDSILSDEQAELEQLFGQTPERKKE